MPSLFSRLFGEGPEPEREPEVEVGPATLEAPADGSLFGFLRAARAAGASDVYLQAGSVPYARVEGVPLRFDSSPLDEARAATFADALRTMGGAPDGQDVEFCLALDGVGRFRANVHHQRRGWGMGAKLIAESVPTLAELELPDELYGLTDFRQGLVLVTGPANCGKSATLAALVGHLNRTRPLHVVTIEDPIEIVFGSDLANVTQRQVGPHTRTFSGALRAALREDPDIVLVSELRDLDTIRTAIVAAETGHLVLGTLHTRDAVSTVDRILDLFPARERSQISATLAGTLRAVVSQVLVPRRTGGRRACAYEVLHVTPAAATHVREGRPHQLVSLLQTGRRHGMIDLDTCLQQLVSEGTIDRETARDAAKDPKRFGEEAA